METAPEFPGAQPPERSRRVPSMGLEIQVHEWGDPEARPVVLAHGMFDHGRGFDTLAPRLAERFRVVSFDARGHGDSDWADAYTWSADLADLARVLQSVGRPAHLVGHSKGGGQSMDVAAQWPDLVSHLVDMDGFGPPPEGFSRPWGPPEPDAIPERMRQFLDFRRKSASHEGWRLYPDLDALVERRQKQNPRLSSEWLRYFCWHGARAKDGGWVWKADSHAGLGFGPWRVDWIGPGWRGIRAPVLAVTGTEPDTWGPLPEQVIEERLSNVKQVERAWVQGAGHFVHMEKPQETADLLLGFLPR